ncbi:MAG: hypothetical protein KDD66_03255 [Bdellovibrionales bacterium]|nr:hypothetical protein [Bdellovibrionales bacterium]
MTLHFHPHAQPIFDRARREIPAEAVEIGADNLEAAMLELCWSFGRLDTTFSILATLDNSDVGLHLEADRLRLAPRYAVGNRTLGLTWELERLGDDEVWQQMFAPLSNAELIALTQALMRIVELERGSARLTARLQSCLMPDADADQRGVPRGSFWYEVAPLAKTPKPIRAGASKWQRRPQD